MMALATVNAMSRADFVAAFGDVAEHSPWVAEAAARHRPFDTREAMVEAFGRALASASREAQLALIRAHPDLATRACLTADSSREQAGAGLDTLDEGEFARCNALNASYCGCFGFPFIFAVKGANKHMILDSFQSRIGNAPEAEFAVALEQICRIFRFRIEDRVAP